MSSGVFAAFLLALGVASLLMGITGSYTLLARLGIPLPGVDTATEQQKASVNSLRAQSGGSS